MKDISARMSTLYDNRELYHSAKAGSANIGRTFINANPNASIKSEYTRDDYDYFRNYESLPKSVEQKISLSMKAYDNVGIVRNVIDLMADFTCKGISIVHPVSHQDKFYKEWWEYVDGDVISERFANYLYRIANVPVSVSYGKIPVKIERMWKSTSEEQHNIIDVKTENRRIPLKYNFINPLTLEVIAPELSLFTGKSMFGLRISSALRTSLASIQSRFPELDYKEIMNLIPSSILSAIKSGKSIIPVDNDSMKIYYYKKDDWDIWSKPMISSIIDDLIMLEKTKLADMSALDGAISNIRLWKIGRMEGDNPSTWIIPTATMINKVRNIIANNVGGGTLDLVWGPDIDFKESNTNVHNFLGSAKYDPILSNIYEGLGVPFSSSSGSKGGKGMTNNFIAMQTFIERLEYGRRVLLNFWNTEIRKVQLAMGYAKPAQIIFDKISLGDDTTYKNLLISLLDRDIISIDAVLKNFGFTDIEKVRIQKDVKKRTSKKLPPKASPFHNPDKEHDLKRSILQGGGIAPSELGVELLPRKSGEKAPNEQLAELKKSKDKQYKEVGFPGRPDFSKDSKKRKMKRPQLQTKAFASQFMNLIIWGNNTQKAISDIVTPIMLSKFGKSNLRKLTKEEFDETETVKFSIFSNLKPFSQVDNDNIVSAIGESLNPNIDIVSATKLLIGIFRQNNDREPTIDEIRQIQSSGYALAYEEDKNPMEIDKIETSSTELELELPKI